MNELEISLHDEIYVWIIPYLPSLIPDVVSVIVSYQGMLSITSNDMGIRMQEQGKIRWTPDYTTKTAKETCAIFIEWDKTSWYETYYSGCENRAPPFLKSAYDQALLGFCFNQTDAQEAVRFLRREYNAILDFNSYFLMADIAPLDEYTLQHLRNQKRLKSPIKELLHRCSS
jgi:hypothetical protein